MFKSKKDKPPPKIKKPLISYRISPTNYAILSEQEKSAALTSFTKVLRAVEKKLKITIINQGVDTIYAGKKYNYVEKMVYFTSIQDLGANLLGTGFKSTRLDAPISHPIKKEYLSHLQMKSGQFCKAYTIHNYSKNISPAWINTLANLCSICFVDISPIKPHTAKRMLISHANTLEGNSGRRQQEEANDARQINDLLQKQMTNIFQVGITAIVTGNSKAELIKNCKDFEKQAKWQQIKSIAISGKQKATYDGWGAKFLFDEMSCAAFYPFVSSDLIEADGAGGVYLGLNELTGTPVIYDYQRRTNYNMIVIGASGFGKSIAAKTYIDNFYNMISSKYGESQKVMSYILDLHGEYTALADYLKMDIMDLMSRGEMGLDPFTLLDSSDAAIDLLTDVVEMPPDLKSLTLSRAKGVKSVKEMVSLLSNDNTANKEDCRKAATYLLQFAQGDLAIMFQGELKVKDKTVISLRKATESNLNSMLISLALQKIWNDIRNAPQHVPKLLVIEEAWFVLRMPSTAAILSNIARSGRKENVHLIVMTQDVDEVLSNEHGSAVIKNSATVLLLGLKSATAKTLQDVLDLSDKERDEIVYLEKGQAIMRADRNRIKLKIKPTDDQLKKFNTASEGFVPTGM